MVRGNTATGIGGRYKIITGSGHSYRSGGSTCAPYSSVISGEDHTATGTK